MKFEKLGIPNNIKPTDVVKNNTIAKTNVKTNKKQPLNIRLTAPTFFLQHRF